MSDVYLHEACGYPVAEYLGEGEPVILNSADWLVLGQKVERYAENIYTCPNCGIVFSIVKGVVVKQEEAK